jgi:endonuclease/exonuclease/phosphatase family metal-dependent hydrolase
VTRHPRIVVRCVTWNLFHGRDFPPNPELFTLRSRLLRRTERDATHVQVNRPLRAEYTRVLDRIEWDVALLQEAPPRWREPLARDLRAQSALTLTSRNALGGLRGALGELNTDLIGSNEGGSNQLLVRAPWRIEEMREHTLAQRPERRQMLWARLAHTVEGAQLAVANVHGSLERVPGSAEQILAAAAQADAWAGGLPLVFGGDLNQRPDRKTPLFTELESRYGLAPPTGPRVIDHLLVRGVEIVEGPRRSKPQERELDAGDGRALRLSDHAYVTCVVGMR